MTLYAEMTGNVVPLHAIRSTMLSLSVFFRNRKWTCICVLHCTVDIVGKLCRTQVGLPILSDLRDICTLQTGYGLVCLLCVCVCVCVCVRMHAHVFCSLSY